MNTYRQCLILFMKANRLEIENLIDLWIFNERDRKILKIRLLDGIIYERLSEKFDLSVRQIKTIVKKGEERLFSKIKI